MNRVIPISKGVGFTENLHTNVSAPGKHIIATEVDTDAVKDALLPLTRGDTGGTSTMYPVRIIPQHVLDRAFREGKFNDKDWWKRWANSPEGRVFGVERNGKVPNV